MFPLLVTTGDAVHPDLTIGSRDSGSSLREAANFWIFSLKKQIEANEDDACSSPVFDSEK